MNTALTTVTAGTACLSVGILGAGVMGRGLASAVALSGHRVMLVDVSESLLEQAMQEALRSIKAQTLMSRSAKPAAIAANDRIFSSTDIGSCKECDIVIENVTEKLSVKREVYAALGHTLRADALIAANTSTFPIAELAALTTHPERVIGLHFMNPPQTKRLVEVIAAQGTSPATQSAAFDFLRSLNKQGILVKDSPGFVSNRVLMLTINEAVRLVDEDIASAERVDEIFTGCFGHPMGPLATADLIGLDTILLSLESLEQHFDDPKYAPAWRLRQLVASNHLGRKSGRGFFTYGTRS
jgi:3-hydroxybutyryl-CoA dehydrogenase